MTNNRPKSAAARGLGYQHRQHRERLLRAHRDGTPCWWCNEPMYRNPERNPDHAPLEADHTRPRSTHGHHGNPADRLLHRRCNRSRGTGDRDHHRPALTPTDTKPAALAMNWPT